MAEGKRFKTFCMDADTNTWQKEAVPKNTRKHMSWSVNVYVDWARSQNENSNDFEPENSKYLFAPDNLSSLSVQEINYWLSKFCVDVRQQNGEEYKHEVLYSLFCAINRVICESKPGLVLSKSPELKQLQNVSGRSFEIFTVKARSFPKES